MKLLSYLWRAFKWWWRCLWEGKVVPRKETKLYSRSYMRKAWASRLRDLDRRFQRWKQAERETGVPSLGFGWLLRMERRMMVMKRRRYLFE
jgi:hypothetical protein